MRLFATDVDDCYKVTYLTGEAAVLRGAVAVLLQSDLPHRRGCGIDGGSCSSATK